MSMQRTNVYADPEDLALIKEGAARLGVPEAEILRRGVHIAAMSVRTWDTPFADDDDLIDLGGPVTEDDIRATTLQAGAAKARKIEEGR